MGYRPADAPFWQLSIGYEMSGICHVIKKTQGILFLAVYSESGISCLFNRLMQRRTHGRSAVTWELKFLSDELLFFNWRHGGPVGWQSKRVSVRWELNSLLCKFCRNKFGLFCQPTSPPWLVVAQVPDLIPIVLCTRKFCKVYWRFVSVLFHQKHRFLLSIYV